MSVLIKGMKMPSVCDCCWALDESGDYPMCRITGETRGYNFRVREKRMDRCPLIELPDHGDLIDLRELNRELARFVRRSNNSDFAPTPTWNNAVSVVESAPIVILAERSEDE